MWRLWWELLAFSRTSRKLSTIFILPTESSRTTWQITTARTVTFGFKAFHCTNASRSTSHDTLTTNWYDIRVAWLVRTVALVRLPAVSMTLLSRGGDGPLLVPFMPFLGSFLPALSIFHKKKVPFTTIVHWCVGSVVQCCWLSEQKTKSVTRCLYNFFFSSSF